MPWYRGACPRDCYDACSILFKVEEGKVVEVRGDQQHPVTGGFICPRGAAIPKLLNSEDRVTGPLLRKGPGKLEELGWPEAVEMLASKVRELLEAGEPGEILHYEYAGNAGLLSFHFPQRFFNQIGATGVEYTICDAAGELAVSLHYGLRYGALPEDLERADLVVFWGFNAASSSPHSFKLALEAAKRGADLFVVDPVRTATARYGEHLRVKPGTDAALALAVANYMIENHLYDREFAERYAYGFDKFSEYASRFTLDYASRVCGLGAREIANFAERYAASKRSVVMIGIGLQKSRGGGEAVRAISLLPALAGVHRGFFFCNNVWDIDKRYLSGGKPARTVNMVRLGRELAAGRFKLLFIYGSNPATTLPNSKLVAEGLERRDLFVAVHDLFVTETAERADLILPAATPPEYPDVYISYWHDFIIFTPKLCDPPPGAKSTIEVVRELARAAGVESGPVFESEGEALLEALGRSRMARGLIAQLFTAGYARMRLPPKDEYQTPSGKVEFYSTLAERLGLSPLPKFEPEPACYPLRLITSSVPVHNSTQYRAVYRLDPVLKINPADAAARGVACGDEVRVFNDLGSVTMLARVSGDVPPGVVWAERSCRTLDGKTINELCTDDVQEIAGGSAFNSTFVEVEKAR